MATHQKKSHSKTFDNVAPSKSSSPDVNSTGNRGEGRCSLCGHPYLIAESKAVPFCSIRCQQIDLGMWLDERLGLPIEGQEEQVFTGFDSDEAD